MTLTQKLALAFTPIVAVVGLLSLISLATLEFVTESSESALARQAAQEKADSQLAMLVLNVVSSLESARAQGPEAISSWFVSDDSFEPSVLDGLPPDEQRAALVREREELVDAIALAPGQPTPEQALLLSSAVVAHVQRVIVEAAHALSSSRFQGVDLRQQLDRAALATTLTFFTLVLASAGLTFYMVNSLVSPLKRLTLWIDAVRDSREATFVPSHRNDEIGRLERAFSEMVDQLRRRMVASDTISQSRSDSLRAILDGLPFPVMVLGRDRIPRYGNRAAQALGMPEIPWADTGERPADDPGHYHDFAETLREEIGLTLARGVPLQRHHVSEALLLSIEGEERFLLPQLIPIRVDEDVDNPSGSLGVAILLQDVTLLHLAYELKTNTLATVSHELRTPLTTLRLALSLLADPQTGQLNDKQERVLSLAKTDLERLMGVVEEIVSFSRLEEAAERLNRHETDLGAVLDRAERLTEKLLDRQGLQVALAPEVRRAHVNVDISAFSEAIAHLATSVAQAAPGQSVVTLMGDLRREAVCLRLELIGHVLSEDQVRAWREPTFGRYLPRAERPSLGLMLAKEIIEAHEASFEVGGEGDRLAIEILIPILPPR